jgi:hypothetical protein
MNPREPYLNNNGLYAEHDQRCAVIAYKPAVIDCQTGVFHPSWEAQSRGWRLVQAKSWFQRLALRVAFNGRDVQ